MADTALTVVGAGPGAASPVAYTIPGAGQIQLKGAFARMDGTAAGAAWLPCVRVKTPNGAIMLECLGASVAAGASADVTWFPGVKDTTAAATGGNGFQFNSGTYGADNSGDYSKIETTAQIVGAFSNASATQIIGGVHDETLYGLGFNSARGTIFSDTQGNLFNNGNPTVAIEHYVTSGHLGGEGLTINVSDTTAAPGDVTAIGAQIIASSNSTVSASEGIVVQGLIGAGGTADAIGIQGSGGNSGTGREIGVQASTAGHQAGASSIALLCLSAAGANIFQVRNDGSVHIKTGTSVIADL